MTNSSDNPLYLQKHKRLRHNLKKLWRYIFLFLNNTDQFDSHSYYSSVRGTPFLDAFCLKKTLPRKSEINIFQKIVRSLLIFTWSYCNIYNKTTVLESFFNKVAEIAPGILQEKFLNALTKLHYSTFVMDLAYCYYIYSKAATETYSKK